jgi:hypothetical protein
MVNIAERIQQELPGSPQNHRQEIKQEETSVKAQVDGVQEYNGLACRMP